MASIHRCFMGCVLSAAVFAGHAAAVRAPSMDSAHDFDFSIGTFKTHIERLEHPLSGSTAWTEWNGTVVTHAVWDGGGSVEELAASSTTGHFEGLTWRLYNPGTHQWNLYWVGSGDVAVGKPMTGKFKQGRGVFYDKEMIDGRAVLVRNIYSGATATSYHFEQAYSADDGKTWETNFVANLTREKSNPIQDADASAGVQATAMHDFDFQFGTWETHASRLIHPLTGSKIWNDYSGKTVARKLWGGRANVVALDAKSASGRLRLASFRLYNPATHQWSLYVANARDGTFGVPSVGGFTKGRGTFHDKEFWNGKPIMVRFVITPRGADAIHFVQAFSADHGQTWETNWIADDTRVDQVSDTKSQ